MFYKIADTATADDKISGKTLVLIKDSVTIDNAITAITILFRFTEDVMSIDDSISTSVSYNVFDSATVDDALSMKALISLADGAKGDSVTAVDKIFTKELILLKDSATISDAITKRVFYNVFDSAIVEDTISKKVFIRLADGAKGDSVTAADKLFSKGFVLIKESTTISDSIT